MIATGPTTHSIEMSGQEGPTMIDTLLHTIMAITAAALQLDINDILLLRMVKQLSRQIHETVQDAPANMPR